VKAQDLLVVDPRQFGCRFQSLDKSPSRPEAGIGLIETGPDCAREGDDLVYPVGAQLLVTHQSG
jgi:hypothetical protein